MEKNTCVGAYRRANSDVKTKTKICRIDASPYFPTHGVPPARRASLLPTSLCRKGQIDFGRLHECLFDTLSKLTIINVKELMKDSSANFPKNISDVGQKPYYERVW